MHILFVILAALMFAPPQAKPDCREIERITGGVELPWLHDENGRGYWDLPDDIELTERVELAEGGIWQYRAKSQRHTRWIWWWGDYEPGYDANGKVNGNHNFCAIIIHD